MTETPAVEPGGGAAGRALGVLLALVAGLAAAAQSRVNGTLAERTQDASAVALLSFAVGLALLSLALLLSRSGRAACGRLVRRLRAGRVRWWECLGGLGGAFFVTSQGLTVATLGVAAFTVALVAGQSVSSLVIDRAGLAPGGVRLVTVGRALGPVLTVVAVVVVSGSAATTGALALAFLPLLAGVLQSFQQALNGRVRAAVRPSPEGCERDLGDYSSVDSPRDRAHNTGGDGGVLAATFVSFVVGTAALLVVFLVSLAVAGPAAGAWPSPASADLVLYSGGLLGVAFIALQAAVVQRIGVLLLGLGMIAGQVVGALVLDVVVPGATAPGPATYAGAALTLVAVAVPLLEGALRRRH